MRNFNEEEKVILSKLAAPRKCKIPDIPGRWPFRFISEYRYNIMDLFTDIANELKCYLEINFTKKRVQFQFEELQYAVIGDKAYFPEGKDINEPLRQLFNVQSKVTTLISLLDYLEKNHLIYYYEFGRLGGPKDSDGNFIYVPNSDLALHGRTLGFEIGNFLNDWFFNHAYYTVLPSYELIDFVTNDFRDKEQIRHEDNVQLQEKTLEQANRSTNASLRLGNISLGIAVISLLVTLLSLIPERNRVQWFNSFTNKQADAKVLEASHNDGLEEPLMPMSKDTILDIDSTTSTLNKPSSIIRENNSHN